ncbi:Response regulator receiver domain-containing protein [Lishizhenia tianjinensis]|uniref:Response regulator receiver domain-containing protein n=1 Tax=Lishizhenia tianjinensis TaxID=477690 RepID=A0A1I6XN40_9FLAO|nr:response regulator [Lishizhenia tianjinensis]SFT39533.1 Response regulator receiver domain-containing protein [Lishizhenia tianjinensis]
MEENQKQCVLFCSPDRLIQKIIKKRLKSEGCKVNVASNGNDALTLIEEGKINLMVTEEMLPFKSGFEIIEICDQKDIPSIIISDSDLENKILEAFDLGAYDFIDKPYSPNELVVRIKNIFKHHRA